jgi:class 3 adenylate cyclase
MAHMGVESYSNLIDEALKSQFISYLAILDHHGQVTAQTTAPAEFMSLGDIDPGELRDSAILRETEDVLVIAYSAQEIVADEAHKEEHAKSMSGRRNPAEPAWFLVGLDISSFKKHHHDVVRQTVGVTGVLFLLGLLIVIFFGILGRYELAHLSIERLQKIKNVLGNFVPETVKKVIEKDPEKAILDRYIQDATVLFLDIEGFTTLLQRYRQETINRVIEFYFSNFLDSIHKNGGDINETAGDGMMVVFQDSDPDRHARNAVKTAVDIQEYCRSTSNSTDSDLFPIKVNIGISSGQVYLGSTKMRGTERDRWTFTASGANTILAARLSDYARGGQTLIGEETARRIRQRFPSTSRGKVPLKNLEDSGEVHEIMIPQLSI